MQDSVNSNPASAQTADSLESMGDALIGKSLKTAGYAYLVGDAALFAAGLAENNPRGAAAGLLWGAGGLAAARYGNPDAEKKLELLTRKLGAYLHKQGVPIPQSPDTKALNQPGGVSERVNDFLYAHPSEALNAVYLLGATQLVHSGIRHRFNPDIAAGVLVGAGALAGLLIPEKKPDPENPAQGAFAKACSWVQEKPLRISAACYTLNNAAMIWAALAKRREHPHSFGSTMRFATAAAYIFGNAMLMISSKKNGEEKSDDILSSLADISASVIAAQPPHVQEALVQNISGYLAGQPEVGRTPQEIADMLHERLATIAAQPSHVFAQKTNPSFLTGRGV